MASAAVTEAVRGTDERQTAPWWTEADQAELEALLWELVDGIFEHRERCERCIAHRNREPGSLPCPLVSAAIALVVDWRRSRDLLSYAQWLRLQQDILQLERDRIGSKAWR